MYALLIYRQGLFAGGNSRAIPRSLFGEYAWAEAECSPTRLTIKLDRLIVVSKSSLLGWFLHVSLIVIIKGRSPMEVSLIVIIKQV
jgi:hypothetical protein